MLNFSSRKQTRKAQQQDGYTAISLPALCIEYPFLKKRPVFIGHEQPAEPLWDPKLNQLTLNTLVRNPDFIPRLVYDCTYECSGYQPIANAPPKSRYFDKLPDFYSLKSPADTTLVFDSRFESGNLYKVSQVSEFEYDCELKYDHGCAAQQTQWYYFRVTNTRRGQNYKFNIVNFYKPDSLYNRGMRPLVYSKREAESAAVGWFRGGHDIRYTVSKKRSAAQGAQQFFTLASPCK